MGRGRPLSWGPGLSRCEAWLTLGEMVVMGEVPRDTDNLAWSSHHDGDFVHQTLPPLLLVLPSGDIIRGGKCSGVCHGGAGPL